MPEQVRCPSCSAALRVPDSLLGKNVKCPKCQTTFIAEGEELAHPKGIVQEPTPAVTRPRLSADDEDVPPEDEERDERDERDELEDEDRPRRGRRRRRYRSGNAEAMVSGPAIALMVAAILGIVSNLGYLTFRLITLATLDKQMLATQKGPAANTGAFQAGYAFGVTGVVVGTLIGTLLCVIVLAGAVQMKKLRNYGLAMSASVIALLPCNCCCFLCMPFGIWSLVVLNNADVKDAFS